MLSHGRDGRPAAAQDVAPAFAVADAARRHEIADRVFQSSVDGILAFDRHLHITAWNPSMERLFGLSAGEVVGRSIFAVLPCVLSNGDAPLFRSTLEGNAPVSHARPFSVEKTGCAGLVDCHYSPLRGEDGATSGGLVLFRDRTRSSEVVMALRDAREQFSELFEHSPVGMALVEMDAERIGTFMRVNDALCRITGRASGDLTGSTVGDVTHVADLAAEVALARRLVAGELVRYRVEKRLRRPDGAVAWVAAGVSLLRSADGIARHAIMHVEDITERRAGRPVVDPASGAEPQPGVRARAAFDAALTRQIADAGRHGHPGALVVLHLDGLTDIDETLGSELGDEAVSRIAELLRRRMRETDVVAALERDEFGILLRFADPAPAGVVATELARRVSTTPVVSRGPDRLTVSASSGVAPIDAQSGSVSGLLARARQARRSDRVRRHGHRGGEGAVPAPRAV
ncbi:MAG: hypothetical protein QOH46_4279 [Solirubrobacteraceae bacterium]|nr:hypothetical protein [Solirubrobacteraceae bacterium]